MHGSQPCAFARAVRARFVQAAKSSSKDVERLFKRFLSFFWDSSFVKNAGICTVPFGFVQCLLERPLLSFFTPLAEKHPTKARGVWRSHQLPSPRNAQKRDLKKSKNPFFL
jgi:hypothetical protein